MLFIMHITQLFVVILLTGLKLSEVVGDCSFNKSQSHCTCSLLDLENGGNLFQCLPAFVFELRGGNLEKYVGFASNTVKQPVLDILQTLQVTKIVFGDLLVPEVLLAAVMKLTYYMRITDIEFESCTLLGNASWFQMDRLILPVSSLRFHNVTSASLANRDKDFTHLSRWLETLQNLTVTQSQVTYIPCSIGKVFRTLRYLDVSENHLQDQSMRPSFCQGAFPQLQVLKLHRNNLSSFHTMCEMLHHLEKLVHLDLSQNDLLAIPSSSCQWQPSLRILNLSTTGLDHITLPLPPNVEVLDVSSNNLHALDLALPFLKKLHLSNNRLHAVPSAKNYPALEVLSLDGNLISHLPRDELQSLRHLQSLRAGRNLYNCSCGGASEIQALASMESLMPDWPQNYTLPFPQQHDYSIFPAKQEACVRAAVGLRRTAGSGKQESFRVVNEDSSRLIFIDKADKDIQEGCFTFDGIFSLDTGQDEVFLELVRPLLAMVPLGYSVSLLLWEAHCAVTKPQLQGTGQHHSIIQQVIETIFQDPKLPGDGREQLQTVSFVQMEMSGTFSAPEIKPCTCWTSPRWVSAYSFYVRGLEDSPAPSQGCSQQSQVEQHATMCASLFTLTVEQELEGCRRQRSAVRILEFPRGAGPCVEPLSPLLQALAPGELLDDAGFLPWILKRVIEGNNLTFLLLCLTLPDASGEEILSALSLAEQVRGRAKKVSPTHWDPAKAAWRQRAEIRELRAQLLSSSSHTVQESVISQLRRVLRDLQVLKNQSWEKKKETSEAFEGSGSCHPEAKGRIPLWPGRDDQLTNQVLTEMLRSQEFLDRGNPKPDGDVPDLPPSFPAGFVPLCNDKGGEAATSSLGWFGRIPPSMGAVTGEKPLQSGASRTQEPTGTASVTGTVGSWASQQHPTLELQFAVAKARRQRLREQHQQLIQQELLKLEEELAGNQELPPAPRDAWCWPKEKAVLALQLEALRREWAEAEKDLEALYQQHRWEAEAQKQHVLQVFRAYRGLSEEQTDALDRRYRKLLQEALQDAISLSAQNQQLRAHSQLGCTDCATQTDPHS
ncbi:uncharacterized protein LOC120370248 isoform X5 [Mauremys reevesii]|uniref:uncharacterized protein LOC120370248 isoform X5 n=1 Tax=Mauremys reevesii TaxID=260615 RepID=UPI00193F2564|nr:uncharacterized protein LOC120370248 isoform X5 [Mauremys reevesii]